MAGLAQRHEVAEVVGSASAEREDVVDFLRRREPPFLLALLTQWVVGDVAGANPPPLASIAFVDLRVAFVLAVVVLSELGVLIAVPAVAEFWASGIGAGRSGLARHHRLPKA